MDGGEEPQRNHVAHTGVGVGGEERTQRLDVVPIGDTAGQIGVRGSLEPVAGISDIEEDRAYARLVVATRTHSASVGASRDEWAPGASDPA